MNDLIEEIERTRISLQDLQDDRENFRRQNAHGMVAVTEGEVKRLRAYLRGLQKAKELIDG